MRQNYPDIFRELLKHLAYASPFFLVGLGLILVLGKLGACMALFLFILGACILGPPLARLLAEPVGGLIFFQGRDKDKPEPVYSQAEAMRSAARYQQALAEYDKMTREFPEEVKPYVEMIEIAVVDLRDGRLAERVYRKGLAAFEKKVEPRQILKDRYEEIRSRLDRRTDLPESIVPVELRDGLDAKGMPRK